MTHYTTLPALRPHCYPRTGRENHCLWPQSHPRTVPLYQLAPQKKFLCVVLKTPQAGGAATTGDRDRSRSLKCLQSQCFGCTCATHSAQPHHHSHRHSHCLHVQEVPTLVLRNIHVSKPVATGYQKCAHFRVPAQLRYPRQPRRSDSQDQQSAVGNRIHQLLSL